MLHRIRWDTDHVRIDVVGELGPEEATALLERAGVYYEGHARRLMLIDHTQSPGAVSKATRAALEREGEILDCHRMAFFGMNNRNRVVARIVVALLGQSQKTGFFATEAESIAWLRKA